MGLQTLSTFCNPLCSPICSTACQRRAGLSPWPTFLPSFRYTELTQSPVALESSKLSQGKHNFLSSCSAGLQVAGCYQIYCRPTYEPIEVLCMKHDEGRFSRWNVLARLGITTAYIVSVRISSALQFQAV